MPQILIVSEDTQFISTSSALRDEAFIVKFEADFETAFRELLTSIFDAVIIDLVKAKEGITFIKRIRDTPQFTELPILVAAEWGSGYGTLALSSGADAYEPMPCNVADLLASVTRLLIKERAVAK